MSGDGDHRNATCSFSKLAENEFVDPTIGQQLWVFVDQIGTPVMTDFIMQIASLSQIFFDPIHDHREVASAELRHNHGYGLTRAQRTCNRIGLVIEFQATARTLSRVATEIDLCPRGIVDQRYRRGG